MSFFISDAYAAADAAASAAQGTQPHSNPLSMVLFIVIIFAFMYFVMIRPQTKRQKEHQNMLNTLSVGDEVVTNGGILGKIIAITDGFISLEIANNVTIKIQKPAITASIPKGTLESS